MYVSVFGYHCMTLTASDTQDQAVSVSTKHDFIVWICQVYLVKWDFLPACLLIYKLDLFRNPIYLEAYQAQVLNLLLSAVYQHIGVSHFDFSVLKSF